LSFRYRRTDFNYIPFWKVIAGEVPKSQIEGKIVLVGHVSPNFHDYHMTPLGTMGGVIVNANELLMFLDKDFVQEMEKDQDFYLIILAIFLTFVYSQFGFFWKILSFMFTEMLLYHSARTLFVKTNILIEPFSAMIVAFIVFAIVLLHRYISTLLENMALQRKVILDGLTGLYAHSYIMLRLESEFTKRRRLGQAFYFAMLDIDYFKNINDTYGHEQGNIVLMTVAKILKTSVRGYDVVGRYGGEEFCILLLHTGENEALHVMERIRQAVESCEFPMAGNKVRVTLSSGLCSSQHPKVRNKEDLVRLADEALYEAKKAGRNRISIK
jgi:diguanylate cyclase (GGDEF)-like protein